MKRGMGNFHTKHKCSTEVNNPMSNKNIEWAKLEMELEFLKAKKK